MTFEEIYQKSINDEEEEHTSEYDKWLLGFNCKIEGLSSQDFSDVFIYVQVLSS